MYVKSCSSQRSPQPTYRQGDHSLALLRIRSIRGVAQLNWVQSNWCGKRKSAWLVLTLTSCLAQSAFAAWCSYCLFLSKIHLASLLHRAEWRAASGMLLKRTVAGMVETQASTTIDVLCYEYYIPFLLKITLNPAGWSFKRMYLIDRCLSKTISFSSVKAKFGYDIWWPCAVSSPVFKTVCYYILDEYIRFYCILL